MRGDQVACDAEAQSHPLREAAGHRTAIERCENACLFLGCDSRTGVADPEPDLACLRASAHRDAALRRRILDGVADQVAYGLRQPVGVCRDDRQGGGNAAPPFQPLLDGRLAPGAQGRGEPLGQREGLPVQLKAAQYPIMELCQVVQQALQAMDLRFHPAK